MHILNLVIVSDDGAMEQFVVLQQKPKCDVNKCVSSCKHCTEAHNIVVDRLWMADAG